MERGVAGNFAVRALYANGLVYTGGNAAIVINYSKDGATPVGLSNGTVLEVSPALMPGWYRGVANATETNATQILVGGNSSTANVTILGAIYATTPPNWSLGNITSAGNFAVFGNVANVTGVASVSVSGNVANITGVPLVSVSGNVANVTGRPHVQLASGNVTGNLPANVTAWRGSTPEVLDAGLVPVNATDIAQRVWSDIQSPTRTLTSLADTIITGNLPAQLANTTHGGTGAGITANITGSLSGNVGNVSGVACVSVSGNVANVTGVPVVTVSGNVANITGTPLTTLSGLTAAAGNLTADYVLRRNQSNVATSNIGDPLALHSLYGVNQMSLSGNTAALANTITVYHANGTLLGNLTSTSNATAPPLTGVSG